MACVGKRNLGMEGGGGRQRQNDNYIEQQRKLEKLGKKSWYEITEPDLELRHLL